MTCNCNSHNGFLTAKGLRELGLPEAAQRSTEGLEPLECSRVGTGKGSMSAMTETETDYAYDEKHIELNRRLIHHGS